MVMLLKQSTTVNVLLGPALDKTDGVTEETGLSPTVYVSKNGGAQAARNSATAITHDALGYYIVELDDTDTGTLGRLKVLFHAAATHLPVWQDFMVIPAQVWNSLIGGTDALQVDTIQVSGTTQTANDVGADVDAILADTAVIGTPAGADIAADIAAVKSDSAAILTDTGTDGVKIGAGAIAAASFAAGAVDAAALATDAVTEIVDAIKAAVVESEGSYTIQQVLSILLAACAGVTASSGATLKSPNGSATRITATINASSERTAMTLTPSA